MNIISRHKIQPIFNIPHIVSHIQNKILNIIRLAESENLRCERDEELCAFKFVRHNLGIKYQKPK